MIGLLAKVRHYVLTLHPPAQHAEDEIHHKECSEDNHGDEVHELPGAALGVVDLEYQVGLQ